MRKRTPTTVRWECVFAQFPGDIDAEVDNLWKTAFGKKAPFGDLRNQWRRQHCQTLNPYGSASCAYARSSCARSFLEAVSTTALSQPKSPVGYFRAVAKTLAAKRADEKPRRGLTWTGTSGIVTRTEVLNEQNDQGDAGTPATSVEEGPRLRSPEDRPLAIGDVFRSLNLGPRQEPPKDGSTSTK